MAKLKPYIDKTLLANEIVNKINEGEDANELARTYGFANKHSMDSLLRRNGYRCSKGYYYKQPEPASSTTTTFCCAKAEVIATEYNSYIQAGLKPDEGFYTKYGFPHKKDMQQYLLEQGVFYNIMNHCYEPSSAPIETNIPEPTKPITSHQEAPTQPEQASPCLPDASSSDLQKYLPLLELLYHHKESLLSVLKDAPTSTAPPRIAIGGTKKVKSVYISSSLILLLKDYCLQTGLTIREVMEVALVDYFNKYGYQEEVKRILER